MTDDNKIWVEFFGVQRLVAGTDKVGIAITENTVVGDVLEQIRSLYPDIYLDKLTCHSMVNHEFTSMGELVKANDVIGFIPCIGGG